MFLSFLSLVSLVSGNLLSDMVDDDSPDSSGENSTALVSLLLDLTSGLRCALLDGDGSEFTESLLSSLVRHVPSVLRPLRPVDQSRCSAIVLAASAVARLPDITFQYPLNPRNRIILLTNQTYTDTEAYAKLYSYRRTRFLWISQQYDEEEYLTFANMTTLINVDRDNGYQIFGRRKRPEKLINFGGAKLRIVTVNYTVYNQISAPGPNGSVSWVNGFDLLLPMKVCGILGLEPEVYTLPPERSYDLLFSNGSLKIEGMHSEIRNWRADAATGGVWLKPNMMGEYDFSNPWDLNCYRYLVPRPRKIIYDWSFYIGTFRPYVWLSIIIMDIAVAGLFTLFSKISHNPKIQKRRRKPFWEWFFTSSFAFLLLYFPKKPAGSLVPLLSGWVWTGFILVIAFMAELNSILVVTELEEKVDTIPGFLSKGYTWGHKVNNRDDPTNNAAFDNGSSAMWKEWNYQRFREEISPAERESRMSSRQYVVPGQSHGRIFFFLTLPIPSYRYIKHYEVADKCYQQFLSVPIFPAGSPYAKAMNKVLSRFRSGGILKSWAYDLMMSEPVLRQYVPYNVFTPTKELVKSRERPLTVGTAMSAFCVLGAGHSLALLVFLIELRTRRKRMNRSPVKGSSP